MDPFKKIEGVVAPLPRVNIDTDAIIPTDFLKRIERTGFGQFLFYEWRFDENGNIRPEFVLNKPQFENASILLTGRNFGCGSSREHAPWSLADYGFRVIIAPSFADIFFNNCFKNGILPIVLPEETIDGFIRKAENEPGYKLIVDLESQTVSEENGNHFLFEVDPYRKNCLLKGLDDIGVTLEKAKKLTSTNSSTISQRIQSYIDKEEGRDNDGEDGTFSLPAR